MNGMAKGRDIPFTDGESGENCPECGHVIRPGDSERLCHSCRVRNHDELIDEIGERLVEASDDHSTRMSILLALRRRMFDIVEDAEARNAGGSGE